MKNRLVIFDLDGTLLNTIGDLAVACDYMLRLRNLPTHSFEEYCSFVGNGILRLVERALPEELRTENYVKAARADFLAYYIDHIDEHTTPYDGITALIDELQQRGYKLAVASNKFQAGTEKLIRKFFPTIDFVDVCGNREGVPLKPDTALIDIILEQAAMPREQCIMVGDSAVDMLTAHNAGIHSIGVTWGFRSREELIEAKAEQMVDNTNELLAAIERI
ncbi:MAG: HAD-IA family hydrolase [Alistipes sp.]|nr:HAD-IA family hydrolase [Alistipes sp.]